MSSRLTSDTRIYADKAKDLNRQVINICCVRTIHGLYTCLLILVEHSPSVSVALVEFFLNST